MKKPFRPGSIVRVRSGGPWMTVRDCSGFGHTRCQYHNVNGLDTVIECPPETLRTAGSVIRLLWWLGSLFY